MKRWLITRSKSGQAANGTTRQCCVEPVTRNSVRDSIWSAQTSVHPVTRDSIPAAAITIVSISGWAKPPGTSVVVANVRFDKLAPKIWFLC
jgi:hypothetical protein